MVVVVVDPAGAPFETFSCEHGSAPFRELLGPPRGSARATVPGACVDATSCTVGVNPFACSACTAFAFGRPTSFGIAMRPGPFETTSATAVPRGSVVPAFGAWATTMPFGFAAASRVTFEPSFAACSWNFADWHRDPGDLRHGGGGRGGRRRRLLMVVMPEDGEPDQESREPEEQREADHPLGPVGARQRDGRRGRAFSNRRSRSSETAGRIGSAAAASSGEATALDERDPGVLLLGRQRPEALARRRVVGESVFELG